MTYFLPIYLQPAYDQAHLVQLEQPTLFIEVETCSLLPYVNSLQHCRELSVLGQVGLTGWKYFCFIGLLSTVIKA